MAKIPKETNSSRDMAIWSGIYETAEQIEKTDPWSQYGQQQPIIIRLASPKEIQVIISFEIIGILPHERAIAIYYGDKGFCDYDILYSGDYSFIPREFVMYDRNAWVLRWGTRKEMLPDNLEILHSLGRRYRGVGSWLRVETLESRFMPTIPTNEDAKIILSALSELKTALRDQQKKNLTIKYDKGECLCRHFDKVRQQMVTSPVKYKYPQMEIHSYGFNDEIMRRRIKNKKQTNRIIEIDFFYNGYIPFDVSLDAKKMPNLVLFIAVDALDGTIIILQPAMPDMKLGEQALMFLHDYVTEYGRMKTVIARNIEVLAALEQICQDVGITIKMDYMPTTDRIMNEIRSGV